MSYVDISMKRPFRPVVVAIYSVIGTCLVIAALFVVEMKRPQPERRRGRPMNVGNRPAFTPASRNPRVAAGVFDDFPLQSRFDQDNDKKLNGAERKAAREFLEKEKAEGRGPKRSPGGMRNFAAAEIERGMKLSPADVPSYGKTPLYDTRALRTFFLEFENADWESELDDFYHTDVEVPAKLTVDGKEHPDVGVQFHGASSFFTVTSGQKRSIVISMDFVNENQELTGFRTLDLLNAHTDPSFLHSVLYCQVAREFLPAARANFARVVINGENWGVYVNMEHFNKDFVRAHFPKSKGGRWKVPGSPNAQGGLAYLGDEATPYKAIYEIKSKDDPTAWRELIRLCRLLNQAPLENLEKELADVLDVDGALRFLALENVLINSDGYWIRSSDYNLFQDETGRFHLTPHDTNETWGPAQRPRFGGSGGEEGGVKLDPLAGADNPAKPLLSRLLAVPQLRQRYLGYVKQIAEEWLDWKRIGPMAEQYHQLIAADVKSDTRKLYSQDAFEKSLTEDFEEETVRGLRNRMSLKSFVEERRKFLLAHSEVKEAKIPETAR